MTRNRLPVKGGFITCFYKHEIQSLNRKLLAMKGVTKYFTFKPCLFMFIPY